MLRNTYAQIDLQRLKDNIEALRRAAGTDVMAVVKADAYGHGMPEVAMAAYNSGVNWMAVATADEAAALRQILPRANILLLASVEEQACLPMIMDGVSMCAYTKEHIRDIDRTAQFAGRRAKVHLKADTGMGRIGFREGDELKDVLDALRDAKNIEVEGLFTHFSTADEKDTAFSKLQLERFMRIKSAVCREGYSPLCHAANSAATIWFKDAHFDLCRLGISMYGYPPSGDVQMGEVELKPVMSFISTITYVKTVEDGEPISYGRTYRSSGRRRIATVCAGYADGYRRALSGKAHAIVGGKRVPQIGRVCMDQIMLDVTGVDAKAGDKVVLMGDGVDADELAGLADTISYEILTGISARVERVYVGL